MAQSTMSFRIESSLKEDFSATCEKMGLTASAALTVFATAVVATRSIPFEVTADPFYSPSNQAAIRAAMDELARGDVVIKSIDELEAMAQ